MKISEMSTDRVLDVLCEITPHVGAIVKDEDVMLAVGEAIDYKGMTKWGVVMAGLDRIAEVVPLLLRTHRDNVYGILSVLNEKTPADIAAQPIIDTMQQVKDIFRDEDLLSFFKSSAQRESITSSALSASSLSLA